MEEGAVVHFAGARHADLVAAAAGLAATRAGLAAVRTVADLFLDRARAERVPLAVRRIADAHTALVTGDTVEGRTEADREDTREERIAARRSQMAVALQAAQCGLRVLRGLLLTGSGIRSAAHPAEVRRSPVLAAQ